MKLPFWLRSLWARARWGQWLPAELTPEQARALLASLRVKYPAGYVERMVFQDHPLLSAVKRSDAERERWERRYDQKPIVPRKP